MKILVVAQHQHDGSPTAIFIHDQMQAYVRAGHEVLAIAPVGIAKPDWFGDRLSLRTKSCVIDGIRYVFPRYLTLSRFGAKYINTPTAVFSVKKQLKTLLDGFQPDVIHAHVLGFGSLIGEMLKQELGCPLVVTTHGSDTFVPAAKGQEDMLKQYAAGADVLVCVSSLLRRTLEACGVAANMRVILNGFDISCKADATPKDPNRMLQVGFLIPRKKTDVSIRAIAMMKEQGQNTALTVVGSGAEMENLQALAQELQVEDRVAFTGHLPNQQVQQLLSGATYFVMPSVREGFGIVYLEAMAAGCVTIGTEGEGIADLIVSGENGFLVPADDPGAIVRVIDACRANPDWAQQIAQRGKEAAEGLTWEKNAQQYVTLFEELQKKD